MFRSWLVESRARIAVPSEAMKLSSPKVLMNAFAAEKELVLDELSAEPICTQHISVCSFSKPMLIADCRKGRQSLVHSSKPRVSFCLHEMIHCKKLGASTLSGIGADTLLGAVGPCFVPFWKGNTFCSVREDSLKNLDDCHQLHM